MPMNLPTLADLQATYGYGDPSVYTQHAANQGLAQQYAQGELSGQKQDVRKTELANIFDEQQNPQLLEQRRLENIGLGNKNTSEGVTARISAATEGMLLDEKQRKFAIQATDDQLKAAEQHAQQEMYSGDPVRVGQAKQILDFTVAARAAKAKDAAELVKAREGYRSNEKIGAGHDAASKYGADSRAATASAKGAGDAYMLQFSKTVPATRVGTAKAILASGMSPVTHAPLTPIEESFFKASLAQDEETVNAKLAASAAQGNILVTDPVTGKSKLGVKTAPQIGLPKTSTKPALPAGWVIK